MWNDLPRSLWNENLWRWRDAFAIVSLDGVRPFFPGTAIALRDPQSFQDALRATIQNYREAYVLTGHQLGSPDRAFRRVQSATAMVRWERLGRW